MFFYKLLDFSINACKKYFTPQLLNVLLTYAVVDRKIRSNSIDIFEIISLEDLL
jgi:hypothetical protein